MIAGKVNNVNTLSDRHLCIRSVWVSSFDIMVCGGRESRVDSRARTHSCVDVCCYAFALHFTFEYTKMQ